MSEKADLPLFVVERFLEKPDLATATAFLVAGGYFWNGGIFVFRVDRMLAEMARQLPEMYAGLMAIQASLKTCNSAQCLAEVWCEMPNISIDYGVMEGAESVAMVPLQAGWNDIGSWDALTTVLAQDEHQNYIARGETLAIGSNGNIVYSDKRLVALIGAHDLVIVDTGDALLVGHKSQMQKVKEVVEHLRKQGNTDLL